MADTLDSLREKQKRLAARIRDFEAKERQRDRKLDTRRKIIAGALALHHMEKNPTSDFTRKMTALIEEYVTKTTERALFGLGPLEENDNDTASQSETTNTYNDQAKES